MHATSLAGRETSRIGLGGGRLVGGSGARKSRHIIETARSLGIRHFDTAPSYGLGSSEDVLGDVLAGDDAVTIVTKVGIGRPSSPGLRALLRQIARPILAMTPQLKAHLARQASAGQARGLFAAEEMRASLTDSLRRLRRETVDAVLLHQPEPGQFTAATHEALSAFLNEGMVRATGSGTGGDLDELVPIGTIAQYRASSRSAKESRITADIILHGALRRYAASNYAADRQQDLLRKFGRSTIDRVDWAGAVLTYMLAENRRALVLVSASSPDRLRAAVTSIDWDFVASPTEDLMTEMRSVLA